MTFGLEEETEVGVLIQDLQIEVCFILLTGFCEYFGVYTQAQFSFPPHASISILCTGERDKLQL